MDDRVFPLGWSADGKFAWITRDVEEAARDGAWRLTVLDAGANKIVETVEFTVADDEKDKGIAKFWAAKESAVLATLKKHGVKSGPATMDHLPLILGERRGRVINAELAVTEGEVLYGTGVLAMKVTLQVGGKKSVILAKKVAAASNMYAAAIAGCFHSPDERFGAIVVIALERGYEGLPYGRRVNAVAGCRLDER